MLVWALKFSSPGYFSDEDETLRNERNEPKPVCRFFNKGQCTWGSSCRFLHPGVLDKVRSLLRIRDVYPGSWFLSIPDPGSLIHTQQQKLVVLPFFVARKHHKIKTYFILEQAKKKLWANLQRIIELFTQKMSFSSQSGIRKKPIPDPGPRSATLGTVWSLLFLVPYVTYVWLFTGRALVHGGPLRIYP